MFWIVYRPTRRIALIFCVAFHLMNSRLFSIGMFPWVCLAELPLFFDRSWPRIIFFQSKSSENKKRKKNRKRGLREKVTTVFIICYCCIQLVLPYSHFITQGYNSWTNGIYGYSWDMMVHAWETVLVTIKVVENESQREHFLHPNVFALNDRWTKHPDMAYQYAHCLEKQLVKNEPESILSSTNISIYFDVWCSLNGRFQQRFFDPNVNMLSATWSPFRRTEWVLPLLDGFNGMRSKITEIRQTVLEWNNQSDVIFVADFPKLTLSNFIQPELTNVSLTLLQGRISYADDLCDEPIFIESSGQHIDVPSGIFHEIQILENGPATYMYTFYNKTTMVGINCRMQSEILPLLTELVNRYDNGKTFFANIFTSMLFEFNLILNVIYGYLFSLLSKIYWF